MKTAHWLFIASLAAAAIFPLIGSGLAGVWWLGLVFVVIAGIWWFFHHKRWARETAVFTLYTIIAAIAAYLGIGAGWLLASMVGALLAWDLDGFSRQVTAVNHTINTNKLVYTHLRRQGLAGGLALVLGGAALLIQLNLSFGLIFLLAVLAVMGLGWLARSLTVKN